MFKMNVGKRIIDVEKKKEKLIKEMSEKTERKLE